MLLHKTNTTKSCSLCGDVTVIACSTLAHTQKTGGCRKLLLRDDKTTGHRPKRSLRAAKCHRFHKLLSKSFLTKQSKIISLWPEVIYLNGLSPHTIKVEELSTPFCTFL